MNHSTYINHKLIDMVCIIRIFFCFPLVYKKHQLYALSRSNAHIHMIGRKRNVDDPSFIISSSLLHFLYVYMLSPPMRVTEKGGAMAKTNERMCVRVIKDNLPLLSLSCACALYHRSSYVECAQVPKYVLRSISYSSIIHLHTLTK
jgi:hypothetical protein